MTIAFVSSTGADAGTVATSTTLTITGFNAGNQMVVMARIGSTTVTPTLTVSTGSGTFTQDGSATDSTNGDKLYWWRGTDGSGVTQIKLAVSASSTVRWAAHWFSVSPGATFVADKTANAFGGWGANAATTQSSGNTATTTVANELLLGFMKTENTHTTGVVAGTNQSYTLRQGLNKMFTEDALVSSTGAYAATFKSVSGVSDPGDPTNGPIIVIQTYYETGGVLKIDYQPPYWNWYEF